MSHFLKSVLSALRITVNGARILFIATAGVGIVTAYLKYSYTRVSHTTLLLNDYVPLTLYGLTALLFAWLGFSRKGRSLLTSVSQSQNESSRRDRLPKVFLASIGLAGGIWLILIVLSLVVGGPDLVVQMFETWVVMVLIAIAFPIAYKWLK